MSPTTGKETIIYTDRILLLTNFLFRYGSTNYGYHGGNVFGNGYYGPGRVTQGLFSGAGWNHFDYIKGPGFLGGADPSTGSMEVFHRYIVFKSLLAQSGHDNNGT